MMFVLSEGFISANQTFALCRVLKLGKGQFLEFPTIQPVEFRPFFRSPTSTEGIWWSTGAGLGMW
jgi:hypothetical protein